MVVPTSPKNAGVGFFDLSKFFRQRGHERQQDRQLRKEEKAKSFSPYMLLVMLVVFLIIIYVLLAIAFLVTGQGYGESTRRLGKYSPHVLHHPQSIKVQLDETSNGGKNLRGKDDDEEAEQSEDQKDGADDDERDSEKAKIKTQDDDQESAKEVAEDKGEEDDDKGNAKEDSEDNGEKNDQDNANEDSEDKGEKNDQDNANEDSEDKGEKDDDSKTSEPKDWNDDNVELNRLWFGRPTDSIASSLNLNEMKLSIVMSYCHGDLYWLPTYLSGIKVRKFTVVAKCGPPPNMDQFPKGVEIIEMSNVGRCDHTVAHWLAQVMPVEKNVDENEIIIFLKDNIIVHQEGGIRDLKTMLAATLADGLGCALEPSEGISVYHATDELVKFNLEHYYGADGEIMPEPVPFKSAYTDMGKWLVDMGISLPSPLAPVCYGGVYAVKRSQISKVPQKIWQNMERSLSRGDNIEEGHFAERTWAGLLHRPLTDEEVKLLQGRSKRIYTWTNAMLGSLMKE